MPTQTQNQISTLGLNFSLFRQTAEGRTVNRMCYVYHFSPQVMILYFQPNVLHCILLRWVRLLGFATVYGTVILKLFRYATFKVLPIFRAPQSLFMMWAWSALLVVRWASRLWYQRGEIQVQESKNKILKIGINDGYLHGIPYGDRRTENTLVSIFFF